MLKITRFSFDSTCAAPCGVLEFSCSALEFAELLSTLSATDPPERAPLVRSTGAAVVEPWADAVQPVVAAQGKPRRAHDAPSRGLRTPAPTLAAPAVQEPLAVIQTAAQAEAPAAAAAAATAQGPLAVAQAPEIQVPAEILAATSFRAVMQHALDTGRTTNEAIVPFLEPYAARVPCLARMGADLPLRVARALAAMLPVDPHGELPIGAAHAI